MARQRLSMIGHRIAKAETRAVLPPPKRADAHYLTIDHKQWRSLVLGKAGYRCEHCGSKQQPLYADHIKELRDGGDPLNIMNGQCLCSSCHTIKTNKERAKRMQS